MPEWYQCYVRFAAASVGSAVPSPPPTPDPEIVITLRTMSQGNPADIDDTPFFAPQAVKNQMLAVALTAISTQLPVDAYIDWPALPAAGWLQCYHLRVVNPVT